MLIKDQIRQLIPSEVKNQTSTLSDEVTCWLKLQHIEACVDTVYGSDIVYAIVGHKIIFSDPKHRTLFLLKYAEYIIP